MDLTSAAIDRSRVTAVALLVVVAGGLWSWQGMSRAEDPPVTYRRALVLTHFPGASPTRVERLITDKVEAAVQQIPELDFVVSRSKTGVSIVIVDIRSAFDDVEPIWDNLRRKLTEIESDLPDGAIGPAVNDDFGKLFGIIVTVTGEGYSYAGIAVVAGEVRDELLRIESVADVELYGVQAIWRWRRISRPASAPPPIRRLHPARPGRRPGLRLAVFRPCAVRGHGQLQRDRGRGAWNPGGRRRSDWTSSACSTSCRPIRGATI